MTTRLVLFFLALFLFSLCASFQDGPGYMDADYYMLMGKRIAEGDGIQQNFIWNYLDDPDGIPHPAFTYWMPLVPLIAGLGMTFTGQMTFNASRIFLILLAACIPLITYHLATAMHIDKRQAFFSGLLSIACGYYLPFLTTTDAFAVFMLLGGIFLLLLHRLYENRLRFILPGSFALGIISGFMHLTRSDGLIWLVFAQIALLHNAITYEKNSRWQRSFWAITTCMSAYLLVMAPWYGRNLLEFQTLMPPGGSRALWMTNYDELFSYPGSSLTFQHWIQSGWQEIIKARLWALGINLQTAFAVQGSILLLPLMILGARKMKDIPLVKAGFLMFASYLGVMTLVFPFPGARGSFFHSGAAFQPLLWVLAAAGVGEFVAWGSHKRNWNQTQATTIFQTGIVVITMGLTLFLFTVRVLGAPGENRTWGMSLDRYLRTGLALEALGVRLDEPVLVNNPPGFTLVTGRPSLVIPFGTEQTLEEVSEIFGVRYLILEPDANLPDLYQNPSQASVMSLVSRVNEIQIYEFLKKDTGNPSP